MTEPTSNLPCGHHVSLAVTSAETREFLYCDLCNERSARNDAESMEAKLSAENKRLREIIDRGRGAVNAAYEQAQAEYNSHDFRADKLDKIVCDWRRKARAALQGEE